MLTAFD